MSLSRAYFLVNGIDTFPGDSKNWNSRGVTWLMCGAEFPVAAEKIEYLCGPVDRAFGQKNRCQKFLDTAAAYEPEKYNRYAIGHSNGCAVIVSALTMQALRFEELHLVSAACDADFESNGLNAALKAGTVGKIFIYCGGQDEPLRIAATWFGKALGYGDLGRAARLDVKSLNIMPEVADRVQIIAGPPWDKFGHGDCFNPENFATTMQGFIT